MKDSLLSIVLSRTRGGFDVFQTCPNQPGHRDILLVFRPMLFLMSFLKDCAIVFHKRKFNLQAGCKTWYFFISVMFRLAVHHKTLFCQKLLGFLTSIYAFWIITKEYITFKWVLLSERLACQYHGLLYQLSPCLGLSINRIIIENGFVICHYYENIQVSLVSWTGLVRLSDENSDTILKKYLFIYQWFLYWACPQEEESKA